MNRSRRRFLSTALAGGSMFGLGDLSFLSRLPRVGAEEAKLDPAVVRLGPDIEPLVRLLEETPRERLLEEVGQRITSGKVSYREVLAALLLAGVRNIQPRPVGFKFHAVLVVNSAHLASLASPEDERWLPIFWALDYFKESQARDEREGDWTMAPVDEKAVPPADKAPQALAAALDRWDVGATDVAAASFARSAGPQQALELFCRYGARDFRDIGHKAIYVANSYRTLQHIGWQHAEPVLRSLAYALLAHEGENPSTRDADADRPWRRNLELAKKINEGWEQKATPDADATAAMLQALRDASSEDACDAAVELLNRGASPQSVWDALLDGAGELLMRRPGIISLHAVTTTNALHYAFRTSQSEETRRMLLLQNVAFLPLFRSARGDLSDAKLTELEPAALSASDPGKMVDEIFADVSANRTAAAQKILTYLRAGHDAAPLMDAARRLLFLKGNNSHDYKFSAAILEDYHHVSPQWRDRFLAASVFNLRGSGDAENGLVQRTRAALGG